ncbi:MAG TPA: hypothetical protein DDZ51_04255, partial [Planctomycetaceae bacterium]|nr:hypothetical protein [Planctomycetaceae bacterium]
MSNIPSSNHPGSGPANGIRSADGRTSILGEKFSQVFHLSNVLRQSGTVSNQLTLSLPAGGDLSPSGPALVVVTWPAQWDFFSLDLELERNEEDLSAQATQN